MTGSGAENLRERLSRALPPAMKARDRLAVTALRSALAAIANAEAVDPSRAPPQAPRPEASDPEAPDPEARDPDAARPDAARLEAPRLEAPRPEAPGPDAAGSGGDPPFAGTVVGLGAAEIERRSLTEAQMEGIVRAEVADREAAAADYERAGQHEHAERLRGEARILGAYLRLP